MKEATQKKHPDHAHLVHFKSSKVFKVRKSPSDGSRKRKLDSNGKYISTKLRQLVKIEAGLWIGLKCGNHHYSSFWGYVLVLWESGPPTLTG